MFSVSPWCLAASALAASILFITPGSAEPLAMNEPAPFPGFIFNQMFRDPAPQAMPDVPVAPDANATNTIEETPTEPAEARPENLRRQIVAYNTTEAPGTIIIDTPHTYLYYVLGQGRAIRYGIGVGRDGFTWSGVETIARKQEWPDWHPPAEMIARQPYLPRMMAGGPANPLGARAMYLGNSLYRIHGTNDPSTIGEHVSSGCIRLTNEDIIDLYNRTSLGAKVVVLPDSGIRAQRQAPTHVHVTRHAAERLSVNVASEAPEPSALPGTRPSLSWGSQASRLY
jgi:lipoprotein-anchoring transpeptidase ErfK/SrfK